MGTFNSKGFNKLWEWRKKKKHGGKSEFQGPGEGSRAMRSMQDTVR